MSNDLYTGINHKPARSQNRPTYHITQALIGPPPPFRAGILEDLYVLLAKLRSRSPAVTLQSAADLTPLTGLIAHAGDEPAVRHFAFMLLQQLGSAPGTLYLEQEDYDLPAANGKSLGLRD